MKLSTKLIILAVILLGVGSLAKANGIYFPPSVSTATATSSVTSLSPAFASTTLAYDFYSPSGSTPTGGNGASLLLQGLGSSTSAVVTVAIEYSQDGIDWYQDDVNQATTSTAFTLNPSFTYAWGLTTTLQKRIVNFKTPVRYARAVFTGTTATSTVWAQIVPAKEVKE